MRTGSPRPLHWVLVGTADLCEPWGETPTSPRKSDGYKTQPVWYIYVGNCREKFWLFGIEISNINYAEATHVLAILVHLGYSSSYESWANDNYVLDGSGSGTCWQKLPLLPSCGSRGTNLSASPLTISFSTSAQAFVGERLMFFHIWTSFASSMDDWQWWW